MLHAYGDGAPHGFASTLETNCASSANWQGHLTTIERRLPWSEDLGPEWTSSAVARLRYNTTDKSWALCWADQHQRFHAYDRLAPSRTIDDLLTEVERDPTSIFWGLTPSEGSFRDTQSAKITKLRQAAPSRQQRTKLNNDVYFTQRRRGLQPDHRRCTWTALRTCRPNADLTATTNAPIST